MDANKSEEEQFYSNSPITFDDFNNLSSVNESQEDQGMASSLQVAQNQAQNYLALNQQQVNLSTQFNPLNMETTNRDREQQQSDPQMISQDQYYFQQQQAQRFQQNQEQEACSQYSSVESNVQNQRSFQQASFPVAVQSEKKRSLGSSNQAISDKNSEQGSKQDHKQIYQGNMNWNPAEVFAKKSSQTQQQQESDFNEEYFEEQQKIMSYESQERDREEQLLQDAFQKKLTSEASSQGDNKSIQNGQIRKFSNQDQFHSSKNKADLQLNEFEQQIQRYQEIQQQIDKKRKNSSLKSQQSLLQNNNNDSDSLKSPHQISNSGLYDQDKSKQPFMNIERKMHSSNKNSISTQQQSQQQQQILYQQQMQQQYIQPQQTLLQGQQQPILQGQQYLLVQGLQQSLLQGQQSPQVQNLQQYQGVQQQSLAGVQQQQSQSLVVLEQQQQQILQQQQNQQQFLQSQRSLQQQNQQGLQQQQQQLKQQIQLQQPQQQQQIQSSRQDNNSYINVDYNTLQVDKKQIESNTLKFKKQWETVLSDSKLNSGKFHNGQQSIEKQLKQLENQQNIYKQLVQSLQQHEVDEKKYYSKQVEEICTQIGIEKSQSQSPQKLDQIKQKLQFTNTPINQNNGSSNNNNSNVNSSNQNNTINQSNSINNNINNNTMNQGSNTNGNNTINSSSSKKLFLQSQQLQNNKDSSLGQQNFNMNESKSDGKNSKNFTFSHNQLSDNGPLFMADINNNSSGFQQLQNNNNNNINSGLKAKSILQPQTIISEQVPDRLMMEKIERIDNQFSLSNEKQEFNQSSYHQSNQDDNVLLQNSDMVNSHFMCQNNQNNASEQQEQHLQSQQLQQQLQQQQQLQESLASINLQCPLHPEETNLYFCGTCRQFNICLQCLHSGLHANHFIVDLQQEVKNINNQNFNSFFLHKIYSYVGSLKERKNQFVSKQDLITQKQKRIMNQQDEIISFAQNKLQEVRTSIDNFEKQIHNEINKVFTQWYESFCADQDRLQELADELQNECDYYESTAFNHQQSSSQLLHLQGDSSYLVPNSIYIYANNMDKIEAILSQENNSFFKIQDLNVSSLENNLTERNNQELSLIVEQLNTLQRKIQKQFNKIEKQSYLENQIAYNQKQQFESVFQPNRSKSPQQMDTFRKSPLPSSKQSKQSNFINKPKNLLSERASSIQEQFYNHLYPSPHQKQPNNENHFRSDFDHNLEGDHHFISYSPSRFEGQNNSQHSLSVNSMFGKSTSASNNINLNLFQSTSILAKHNQSQKNFENHSHRKTLSHRKVEINNPSLTRNYETLTRIKQNLEQFNHSPLSSSQKKPQLVQTRILNAGTAANPSSSGVLSSISNASILKSNQNHNNNNINNYNNENLANKFFSNTSSLQSNITTTIGQNSKRQNLRNRKSEIDISTMKNGYEDFKNSNKFFNGLVPSSTTSQLQRASPKRQPRVENQLATHRIHQSSLQKNNPTSLDQQNSCNKMMSNLIKYKQLYNKGKRSFFDQSSNGNNGVGQEQQS